MCMLLLFMNVSLFCFVLDSQLFQSVCLIFLSSVVWFVHLFVCGNLLMFVGQLREGGEGELPLVFQRRGHGRLLHSLQRP